MQRNDTRSTTNRGLLKVALSIGFLALAGAAVIAHRNPATGYEVSVYAGTPTRAWIGLEIAFAVSLVTALSAKSGRLRGVAILLGGGATTLLAGLPIVRGYYYYGGADSLTHLGWTREVAAGELNPMEIIYPGIHSFAVLLNRVAGFDITHSLMLVVLAFVVLYALFVTLSVRLLTSRGVGMVIGAFVAFLLLPINHVVTGLNPHPITQASMFLALVLFLLVKFVSAGSDARKGMLTGAGTLLALTSVAVVLYHPQQAAVVVLFFVTVAAVQFVFRRSRNGIFTDHRSMHGQTLVATGAFIAWVPLHGAITRQMRSITTRILAFIVGSGDQAVGSVVTQRGASLTSIGSGVADIFAKLFLVGAVVTAFAGLLFLATLRGRIERESLDAVLKYVFAGLAALSVFAMLHFVGNLSTLFFRYFAMIMVVVSILGAVELSRLSDSYDVFAGGRFGAVSLTILLLLLVSAATLFPSPFIYQANEQKTQMQLDGYESSFAVTDQDAEFLGVGYASWRYRHAVEGPTDLPWDSDTVEPTVLRGNLTSHYAEDRYVVLSEYDRQRETTAYQGIQYTERDLARLEQYDGVHRVQANGEVDLYHVDES